MIEFEISTNKKQIDFDITQGIPKYVPANFQSKTVIPTTEQQVVRADMPYDGLEQVTVEPIKVLNKIITQNGTYNAESDNLNGYSSVEVNVQPTLQEKSVTITENGATEVVADYGYDGLSKVSVEANVKDNSLLNVIKGLNSYNTTNYPFELTADMWDENSKKIGKYKYFGNNSITKVEIPSNINTIAEYAFAYCDNLEIVSINGTDVQATETSKYIFYSCYKLKEINAPLLKRVTESMFALSTYNGTSYPLREVNLPSVEELKHRAFSMRQGLEKIRIPNCNTINSYAFYYCYTLKLVDFRGRTLTTIPTLSSTNAFIGSVYKIVVPDELYDQWIVATNWASIANKIVKASEYTEA